MKEDTLLDILIYLFETYVNEDSFMCMNPKLLGKEMVKAGFRQSEVNDVLHWFNDLSVLSEESSVKKESLTTRLYTKEECLKIDINARNYLLYLERVGIINKVLRELIIDRVMVLDADTVGVSDIKWTVFVVLFKGPYRKRIQSQLLAALILSHDSGIKH